MNVRTRLLVGAALLAVAGGTFWVAASQSQADVLYVEQVLAAPAAHRTGSWTLLGIPQPEQVPFTSGNGTVLLANAQYANATVETIHWGTGDAERFATHTLAVTPQADGRLLWSFRNETRRTPADPTPLSVTARSWTYGRLGQAFPVTAFAAAAAGHADTPRVWAVYADAPEHPMQPKPSQFTGHLLSALPDGTVLPDGANVYVVSQFTAGCSSKFLPPDVAQQYAQST